MSNSYDPGKENKLSILGPTLSFKGELIANENLLIQGKVEGSIRHSSNLTIGPDGKVAADVQAEYIEVEGQVRGDLKGNKSVVVRHSADVEGNIYSPSVSVHEGSTFNGKIDMSGRASATSESAPAEEETATSEPARAGDGAVAGADSPAEPGNETATGDNSSSSVA